MYVVECRDGERWNAVRRFVGVEKAVRWARAEHRLFPVVLRVRRLW